MTVTLVEVTGSTNADLLAKAASGEAQEGDWLVAERQTAGRGRLGREWQSPSGNLYASTVVALRDDDPPASTLSMVSGLAMHLASHASSYATLKWPNDVVVQDRKLAGILLERHKHFVIVGFGANVAFAPSIPGKQTTCVADEADDEGVTWVEVFEKLREWFAFFLEKWRTRGFDYIKSEWENEAAHSRSNLLKVELPNGATVEGYFSGLADDGGLRLQLASGKMETIYAGEVEMVRER